MNHGLGLVQVPGKKQFSSSPTPLLWPQLKNFSGQSEFPGLGLFINETTATMAESHIQRGCLHPLREVSQQRCCCQTTDNISHTDRRHTLVQFVFFYPAASSLTLCTCEKKKSSRHAQTHTWWWWRWWWIVPGVGLAVILSGDDVFKQLSSGDSADETWHWGGGVLQHTLQKTSWQVVWRLTPRRMLIFL